MIRIVSAPLIGYESKKTIGVSFWGDEPGFMNIILDNHIDIRPLPCKILDKEELEELICYLKEALEKEYK